MSQLNYEAWEPLFEIAQFDWCEVSEKQLVEWASKSESNGFPEPEEVMGRYKFYDPEKVKKWYILYRKATKRMGRGEALNNGQRSS